jgi:2-polyprenyl-6-methoxyphenol hydroxylase-like FAD-dependent oxidoreductase
VDELQEWKQIFVLSVESSRLAHWHKPGLLLIGDAAHVMSPVGGVGINYAIGDAVVASNELGPKLSAGQPLTESDLGRVQRQREWPTRVMQRFQSLIQQQVLHRALHTAPGAQPYSPPGIARLILSIPGLRTLPPKLVGFGLWPPHVKAGKE